MKKCGYVSIVGRPNVGKSTLLNSLLDYKLAITSDKSGTTRNIIQGIYNDDESQIIFVDTPGIHKPQHRLGTNMNRKAYNTIDGVDVVLFVIDCEKGYGKGDDFILERIKNSEVPVYLILNKVDRIVKENLLGMIMELKEKFEFKEIIPISALKKDNLQALIKCLKDDLPVQDLIFDEDELTTITTRFLISEIVREKLLRLTKDEIPHSVTCYTETFEEEENIVNVGVVIVVDRDNLKKIIIGKQGQMLKEVGTRARFDIEKMLEKKVYLTTFVKVLKSWRDKEKHLVELELEDE